MPNADCEFALKDGVLEFKEPARRLPSTWVQGTIVNSFTVGPQQQVWKRRVASAIKRVRDGSPWDPRDLYAVTLEFRFHPGNHQNQELDVENYVKPVVDAVAAGLFLEEERDPSEIQTWAFPDSNFRTLLIHRAADPKDRYEEGVHVSVSARRWRQNPPSVHGPGSRSPIGAATGAATPVPRGWTRLLSALGRRIEATPVPRGWNRLRRALGRRIEATPVPRGWNSQADGHRFVSQSQLEDYIKNYGAYRAMGGLAYHTDPACIWGTRIKRKNLRSGFGKDGKPCAFCRPPPSWSPT